MVAITSSRPPQPGQRSISIAGFGPGEPAPTDRGRRTALVRRDRAAAERQNVPNKIGNKTHVSVAPPAVMNLGTGRLWCQSDSRHFSGLAAYRFDSLLRQQGKSDGCFHKSSRAAQNTARSLSRVPSGRLPCLAKNSGQMSFTSSSITSAWASSAATAAGRIEVLRRQESTPSPAKE